MTKIVNYKVFCKHLFTYLVAKVNKILHKTGFPNESNILIFYLLKEITKGYFTYDMVYMITGIIPYSGGDRSVIAIYFDVQMDEYEVDS